MAVVEVTTRWLDERGEEADLKAKVGRLGDDVRLFALHTLGWIRIGAISRWYEFEFDPRAARPATVLGLIAFAGEISRFERPWVVKANAYTGQSWVSIVCSDQESDRLVDWIKFMAEFGQEPPAVPSALQVSELSASMIERDGDPVLCGILGRWRETSGRLDFEELVLAGQPRAGSNVKALRVASDGSLVFSAYRPSTTALWAPSTFGRFLHSRVIEAVPDRALAQQVVRSAIQTLAGGRPRAERFTGPCQRSDGSVEELDWMRVSLPIHSFVDGHDALIVYCRRMAADAERRLSG